MDEAIRATLAAWASFYTIVGAAAGALTGLQFVVIALVAQVETHSTSEQISAFGSPTILHFVAPLVVSAIATAPWGQLSHMAIALEVAGLSGFAFAAEGTIRARQQEGYETELSDWIWYSVIPLLGYALLTGAAFLLQNDVHDALFGVAAVSLLLLLVAVHNAWDTVTFIAVTRRERERKA